MTPHEVLVAARQLIADERNWIKDRFSRNTPDGVCYCSYGAVRTVGEEVNYHVFDSAWSALADAVPEDVADGPIDYNDRPATTHADVLAMFDRAIEATAPVERVS